MGCTKRTPKIRLSSDVVSSEQVCLIGQRIVPMLFTIEIIGTMEIKFGRISDSGIRFVAISGHTSHTSSSCKHYMSLTQNNRSHSTFTSVVTLVIWYALLTILRSAKNVLQNS